MKRAFFHRSIHRGDDEEKKKKFHDAFNAMKHPLSIPLTLSRDSHEFTDTVACSLSTNPFHDEIHCTWY